MYGVFTAEPAIFLKVQLVWRISLVLGRRVIFTLAFAAGEENNFSHCLLPLSQILA
jgi:hypothetical protein